MGQATFAELYYDAKKRTTRRERFLERLDRLVPWRQLEQRIAPHYPMPGRGRQPYPLSLMLRVHIVQLVDNLSDPAMEDALYENLTVQRFVGLRLGNDNPFWPHLNVDVQRLRPLNGSAKMSVWLVADGR